MSVEFSQKGKKVATVECYRNLNLLAHAQLEELDIGSLCGGHGICGGDKILISSGQDKLSPLTDAEKQHLTPEEIQSGMRLGCQSWPMAEGLRIEIRIQENDNH